MQGHALAMRGIRESARASCHAGLHGSARIMCLGHGAIRLHRLHVDDSLVVVEVGPDPFVNAREPWAAAACPSRP
jgi:hypothetical protein